MEKEHRERLKVNRVAFVEYLIVNELFLSELMACNLITDYDMVKIQSILTRYDKAGHILDVVKTRGPEAFKKFQEVLRNTGQGYLADILDRPFSHSETRKTAAATTLRLEEENAMRMGLLIHRSHNVLQYVLSTQLQKTYPGLFDPADGRLFDILADQKVQHTLLRLKRRNVLNASQMQLLYPSGNPSTSVALKDLDLTLTVILLRNITTLNPNARWDNPPITDKSIEAQIGRVKKYRNYLSHGGACLTDTEFNTSFTEIKSLLLSLSPLYTSDDYDKLLTVPLYSDFNPGQPLQLHTAGTGEFNERLRRLCASGKIPVYRQRVAIVGPYGVGKTFLAKRLLHEEYVKEDANTAGVNIYRHRCIVHKAGRSCWIRGKDDPKDLFAQNMAIGVQNSDTFCQPDLPVLDQRPLAESLPESEENINKMMTNKAATPGGSESAASPDRAADAERDHLDDIEKELLEKIEKIARGEDVEPEKQVTIWDFAGQDVYYTTHQTFLSERIIYLLVFRLDKDLDEKIPVYRGEKTVKEFIMFWLNSIHMHTIGKLRKEDKNAMPYVLIIGTHKDMLGPQGDVEKIFDKLKKCLDDKQVLKDHVYRYFAISNLAEDDGEFAEIKRAIEDLCGYSSNSEVNVQHLSVSWIKLEMNLAKKSEETPIITIEKLREMAQRVGLPDGELQANFIPYHHCQGDILHFKVHGLKDVVIIDPLWLAVVFSAIMTPASIHSGCSHGDFLKDELERGVLKEEVFDEYLKEIKMVEKKTEIIRLMLHFDLMLEISQSVENPLPGSGKRRFVVPSMLVSNNRANETDPLKYLLISFPHILFPTGLFHRLIIRLLKKYNAQQYENNIPVVGFDSASFRMPDKQSVLHIAIEDKAMKLFITNATRLPPKPHIYSEARQTVKNELSILRDTYCPRMHFGYCIRLKNDGPNIPINAQDFKTGGSICVCVENSEVSVDLRPYRVWFSAVPENQDRRAAMCPENKYKNDSEPRGRALIINNRTFSVDWLPERDGTEEDVVALRKLFRYLHYETDVISNLTANEMKEEIKQESQRDDHKNYNSFILFLLSHGTEGAVYGTDGYPLPYKYIKAILNNRNCLGLSGKPKMIFIQACQGKIKDSGALPDGQTAQQSQQAPPAANLGDEVPDAPHEIPKPSNDPTMSDFLEVHATSPEYVSWRHTEKGTWFVQSIVDTFYREAHKYDVLQMLVNVNDAISQKQTLNGNKQAPEIVTSLRKKVFFNITPDEQE